MRALSIIEITALIEELHLLESSYVQKIEQPRQDCLVFKLYTKDKQKLDLKILPGLMFFLSKIKEENPQNPFGTLSFLRKHLQKTKLEKIEQIKGERAIKLVFSLKDNILELFIGLFSEGAGFYLKENNRIIGRQPINEINESEDILNLNEKEFTKLLNSPKEVSKILATDLKLTKQYAEYLCEKINLDKSKINITEKDKIILFKEFEKLKKLIKNPNPYLLLENKNITDFSILPNNKENKFKTISELLDEYYKENIQIKQRKEQETLQKKSDETKLNTARQKQEENLKKFQELYNQEKTKADLLYQNFDIAKKFLEENKKEIELEKIKIQINPKFSVQQNAAKYYELAKKYKKKIEGVKRFLEQDIKKLETKATKEAKQGERKKTPQLQKSWYQSYRWLYTTNGFLAIGGKDARSNEEIIKKRAEKTDLIFHADLSGAPFFVLKNGQHALQQDQQETAQAAASFSKAWKSNLSIVDVYSIKPEQVSKKPGSGQYLATGAFVIYGEKTYFRKIELELAVGLFDNKFMCGPKSVFETRKLNYIKIIPGEQNKNDAAKQILQKLNQPIQRIGELLSVLPSDGIKIIEK